MKGGTPRPDLSPTSRAAKAIYNVAHSHVGTAAEEKHADEPRPAAEVSTSMIPAGEPW